MGESKHLFTGHIAKDLYRSQGAIAKDLDAAHQKHRAEDKARYDAESRESSRINKLLYALNQLNIPDMASHDLREKILSGKINSFRLPSEEELSATVDRRFGELFEPLKSLEYGKGWTERRSLIHERDAAKTKLRRLREAGRLRLEIA